jgi:hypothetical protein
MLQWEPVDDENATYPFERYSAVTGGHEYRIFYRPDAGREGLPWILAVRAEAGGLRHHGYYPSEEWAMRAAQMWEHTILP